MLPDIPRSSNNARFCVSMDTLDTPDIPGLSMDRRIPTPLFRVSVDSVDTTSTSVDHSQIPHFLTPCQSIRGFPGYCGHPWMIPRMPHFLTTLCQSIRGFRGYCDAALSNPPLSEYPWIPWILRTSVDHPRMPHFITTLCQSIRGFRGYCGHLFFNIR